MKYLPLLILVCSFFYFSSGTRAPMFFYDEERNSECAREMAERKDFIVPTFNYELRSDKPILHYYFMMISYSIFGVNEFASRFFSALMGACVMLITFLFIKKHLNIKTALFTVLILIASLNFSLEFHLAVPDPYLIFFLAATHMLFYEFYVSRKIKIWFLIYIALGLAILTKGPVALGLFSMNVILFLIVKKKFNWRTIKSLKLLTGILIVLIIVLPWFIKVGLATDWQWHKEFFLDQNIKRMTNPMEGHGGFLGLTIIYVFLAFIPFAFFLIQSFHYAWKIKKENDLILFSLIISSVTVLFFTISVTKLPNYPMPAYPFIALIAAFYLTSEKIKHGNILLIFNFLLSLMIPVIAYLGTKKIEEISFLSYYCLIFLIIPLCAVIALKIRLEKKNQEKILIVLSTGWIITSLLIFNWVLPLISKQDPVQQALPLLDTSKPAGYYRRFNSAFPFYLKKPLKKLSTKEEIADFFIEHPQGYLISAKEYENELTGISLKKIFQKKDLFETPVTTIYIKQDNK